MSHAATENPKLVDSQFVKIYIGFGLEKMNRLQNVTN